MLDSLRQFIRQRRSVEFSAARTESPHDEIQLAASALLLELAFADGDFTARAIGGLSQNLENLGARGDFRAVYEEMLALVPEGP